MVDVHQGALTGSPVVGDLAEGVYETIRTTGLDRRLERIDLQPGDSIVITIEP